MVVLGAIQELFWGESGGFGAIYGGFEGNLGAFRAIQAFWGGTYSVLLFIHFMGDTGNYVFVITHT